MKFFILGGLSLGQEHRPIIEDKLQLLFQKRRITIAVTDSGLGGLAVMADVAAGMKAAGIFRKVNLIFFNALFSAEGGYNSLKTREEKILVFNSALESLERNYRPDLILIGCHTLSVIYEATPFAKKTKTPIVGIVEAGVELIAQGLKANPDSVALIFGTSTTIQEDTHKKMLQAEGFEAKKIIGQACPELETFIEKGRLSDETEMLIAGFVDEALQKLPAPKPPLIASLNCTHYGYSLPLWEKAFEAAGVKPLAILNPNLKMADFLFEPERKGRFPKTEIFARVVSMVEIARERIDSLGAWLRQTSPDTAAALVHYELKSNLFDWKKFIKAPS